MKRRAAKSMKNALETAGKECNKKYLRWRIITEDATKLSAALAACMGEPGLVDDESRPVL